ncbi:carbohydrate ABC transporter permease [Micromonospora sp. NPDC048930]|uniref:carbohydrate ABC transporter permease n=1 Tax=Micromonospora sp. NPDC048930 TaxID=3364261 RepID=UPI0037198967
MSVNSRRLHRPRTAARLLTLSAMALVMIAPFGYMVSTSFKPNQLALDWPPRLIPDPATIDNYVQAWTANDFGRYFANSAMVAVSTTVATTLLAAMAAYAFARFRFPGRDVLFWAMMLGLMVPGVVILIPQFVLARSLHLTDSLSGLVFFYVGGGIAFNTFLLRGFFEDLPHELDESMTLDGAGTLRRFVALYLPLSRPALATSAVFAFLGAWDEYSWALTTINDPAKQTLPLAIAKYQGQHATSWGLVFAASIIALVPVVLIYLVGQRHFISGLTSGAVKS